MKQSWIFCIIAKSNSVSHDTRTIILICYFAAKETIIIINVENIFLWNTPFSGFFDERKLIWHQSTILRLLVS